MARYTLSLLSSLKAEISLCYTGLAFAFDVQTRAAVMHLLSHCLPSMLLCLLCQGMLSLLPR